MAAELTVNFTGAYSKSGYPDVDLPPISGVEIDVAGKRKIQHTQLIGITEEALIIGELASLGYAFFKNLDPTNYLELRMGTGAAYDMIKLLAGEFCWFRFGSDITAPYAIANAAPAYLFYTIFET